MTSKASYSLEELGIAVQQIKEEVLSYRKAVAQYGSPRNTFHDHVPGKAARFRVHVNMPLECPLIVERL